MKFYSRLQINLISILIAIIIYFFIMKYIPQLYKVLNTYFYYQSQLNLVQDYEEEIST